MNDTFMKERPVLPLIISMALPMVISMLVNSLYNIVDSFFVAQISEDAMTALSLVYPMQNLINAIAIGFGVGINAQIAFHLGAGNRDRASAAATHGTALAALHGVLLTVVSIATIRWFLGMFTADGAVIDLGVRYSRIAFAFSAVISIELAYEKLFQAAGRMKLTMLSMLSGCVANIILDPVLIFGIGPFPALGIEGAAIATGLGQVLTLIVYLIVYARFPIPVRISRRFLAPDRQLDLKLYSVGIPAALNLALPSVMISALNTILAAWSQSYIVILGVYYKLQTFLYLPASGIVQGMRPVIGYNYGAGEKRRVAQIYPGSVQRHHGPGHRHLPPRARSADRPVHGKSGHRPGRGHSPSHHMRGLCRIICLRHFLRRAGRDREGLPLPHHLPVPVHCGHPARGLPSEPAARADRRVARLLDHGIYHRLRVLRRVPAAGRQTVAPPPACTPCTAPPAFGSHCTGGTRDNPHPLSAAGTGLPPSSRSCPGSS